MGALTASLIAIAGLALGWITIEIACKPCLESGRAAIEHYQLVPLRPLLLKSSASDAGLLLSISWLLNEYY
ncbi:hypothetical protein CTI12_AA283800 [Artemisia annua]|nr:hypothetical protein CTI12_AA283800 [Artemisia annua]